MILMSIEEGISFKVEVFPMIQPEPSDFGRVYGGRWLLSFDEYLKEHGTDTTFVFVEILRIIEPPKAGPGQYVNSEAMDADPETWEDSPLHREVVEAVRLGGREFLFTAGGRSWIVTGEWSVDVQIEEEA